MKKVFFVFTAFLVFSLQSHATAWVQVSDNEYIDKDSIEYYINDQSETKFDKKTYWVKRFYSEDSFKDIEKITKKKVAYCLIQEVLDMTQKRYAIKSIVVYDKDGNSIYPIMYKDYQLEWNTIIPDSYGELRYNLIRKPRLLKKMYKIQLTQQHQ